jgi:hypothetical protein
MSQWYGLMNQLLPEDWVCQTCGTPGIRAAGWCIAGFTWGFVHGMFRCDQCHTKYTWRSGKEILTRPACLLKEDYLEPAREGWQRFRKPMSEWTEEMWAELSEQL